MICSEQSDSLTHDPHHAVWNVYLQRLSIHAPNNGCVTPLLRKCAYQTHLLGFLRVPGRSRFKEDPIESYCALIFKDISCARAFVNDVLQVELRARRGRIPRLDTCFHTKSWHCWKNREKRRQSLTGNLKQWYCKQRNTAAMSWCGWFFLRTAGWMMAALATLNWEAGQLRNLWSDQAACKKTTPPAKNRLSKSRNQHWSVSVVGFSHQNEGRHKLDSAETPALQRTRVEAHRTVRENSSVFLDVLLLFFCSFCMFSNKEVQRCDELGCKKAATRYGRPYSFIRRLSVCSRPWK